jgi:hypothetical protein
MLEDTQQNITLKIATLYIQEDDKPIIVDQWVHIMYNNGHETNVCNRDHNSTDVKKKRVQQVHNHLHGLVTKETELVS